MTFIRLGVSNAWRNLARSAFAILSMSIAAGFLTYSISLSRGYTQLIRSGPRGILGGEITVYARQFGGVIPEGESTWHHSFLEFSPTSDLAYFHPELLQGGYLSSDEAKTTFSAEDLAELKSALREVTYIYPRYQLPAVTRDANRHQTPLRGRDAALDAQQTRPPSEFIVEGRWFTSADEGELVAVVSTTQKMPEGSYYPGVGSKITVEVPRISYLGEEPIFLEAEPLEYTFTVIGLIEIPTRRTTEDIWLYWELDEIQTPLGTWQRVWDEVGGREYEPEQVTLGYGDLSYLEDVVFNYRQLFPQFTFYSSIEHFRQAEQRGLYEKLTVNEAKLIIDVDNQSALPLDLRVPFAVMIFLNAALVVAANLLIMVNERKKEIGIIKAVGAMRPQVALMVLSEGLLISLVGAMLGFIFFRFPAMLTQLTNGTAFTSLIGSIFSDALMVGSLSLLFAFVFGLFPGWRTANLSIMEVLRDE